MKLTEKLLGYLNRVFDKDPHRFLALRLRYSGSMTWTVEDGVLTTAVTGGPGAPLVVDLSQYTIEQLVSHLASQAGYSVEYADATSLADMCALVLIDGSADQDASNGDHLYGYTTLLWSYLEAQAIELKAASVQIGEMLEQMEIPSADDFWLDEHGGYYGVRRRAGELDADYASRMIAEIFRIRGNNVAIEVAIEGATGQEVTVTDVTVYSQTAFPLYDGAINYDGSQMHNADAQPLYGLFDVVVGYDLEGDEDPTEFQASVTSLVNALRDAGTHMRSLSLSGSQLDDSWTDPITDSFVLSVGASLSDSVQAPIDILRPFAGTMSYSDAVVAPADDLDAYSISTHTYNGGHDHGASGRQVYYDSGEQVPI